MILKYFSLSLPFSLSNWVFIISRFNIFIWIVISINSWVISMMSIENSVNTWSKYCRIVIIIGIWVRDICEFFLSINWYFIELYQKSLIEVLRTMNFIYKSCKIWLLSLEIFIIIFIHWSWFKRFLIYWNIVCFSWILRKDFNI